MKSMVSWLVGVFALAAVLVCPVVVSADEKGGKKKLVFIAGGRSHAYGQHAFKAGCELLKKRMDEAYGDKLVTELYTDNWPKDSAVLDNADAIVIYCDGGANHPVNKHLDQIDMLAKKGVGIAMMHYGVETVKGKSGDRFLDWIGGYFEMNWSSA
jgi:hypothetical protein